MSDSFARGMRRQAARREAKIPPGQAVTVYHGTSESRLAEIRRGGLRPQAGVGPFVTDDETRAAGYAVRAACVELYARGLTDVKRARPALLLTLRVDRRKLVADDAYEGDFLLSGGCSWAQVTKRVPFSPAGYVRDDEVEGYATRATLAQTIEGSWQDARFGMSDEDAEHALAAGLTDAALDRLGVTVRRQLGTRSGVPAAQDAARVCGANATFAVLGVGYSRVVVAADAGYVAKIGWLDEFGRLGNLTELAAWRDAPREVRDVLCPCERMTPGGVLIQRRAEPLLPPHGDPTERLLAVEAEYGDELRAARALLLGYGVANDLGVNQFGRLDGRLVAFDYARMTPERDAVLEPIRRRLAADLADELTEAAA